MLLGVTGRPPIENLTSITFDSSVSVGPDAHFVYPLRDTLRFRYLVRSRCVLVLNLTSTYT